MAGIIPIAGMSGLTQYAVVRNASGQVYNGSTFEAFNAGNWSNYDIAQTEQGSSGFYSCAFPSIAAGRYHVTIHAQQGGSPDQNDPVVSQGFVLWTGTDVYDETSSRLNQLIAASASGVPPVVGSLLDQIMNKSGSQTFDPTTDSLEAIRDSGGGGPTAAQIADAVWDELLNTGHSTSHSAAVYLKSIFDKLPSGTISDFDNSSEKVDLNTAQSGVTIGAVNDLGTTARGRVADEISDALGVDTMSELTAGAPSSTPTIKAALMLLYMALRNKRVETASESKVYNNAGTVIAKATTSDNGTEFTKEKLGAP